MGDDTLLLVLVAFITGIAIGRLWSYFVRGAREERSRLRPPSIHYILGLDHLASRQIDSAVSELTLAARENTEATEIYLILGNLLREKGQLERAIQIHQSILHRPGLSEKERTHSLLCLGMDFKRAGFRNRAMDTFREVVSLDPDNAYALSNLVKIYEEDHDWARALATQEELARVTGREESGLIAFLYDQIGQAAWQARDEPGAARAFDEAIRVDKRLPPAHLHKGDLLESQGKLEEAETCWQELAKASPEHAYLVFERLSRVREALGRSDKMEELFSDVVANDERDWRAHVALANIRREQGRGEEAFELLLRAVRNNPHALAVHLEVWKALGDTPGEGRLQRYLDEVSSSVFFLDPYVCIHCEYRANGMLWRCPHCQEWNTFVEERLETVER